MAKLSMINKNNRREKLSKSLNAKRTALLKIARDRSADPDAIFEANLKLAKLTRNGNPTRVRNRCMLTGRPHGFYRRFRLSRIALRQLASDGLLPGVRKSSW